MSIKNNMRFIESTDFPVDVVNEASASEKQGGGRPPHWEMVFWWTRKPLAGARAVVAGALLPAETSSSDFKIYLGFTEKTPHRKRPNISPKWREVFSKVKLLDPFAGFGSIPLEAVRLGIGEVVAVELLPVAYIFLKAVLEYPKWAIDKGVTQKLVKDVERWGKWIIEKLHEDPDIKELYDDDTAVYIGTWEVKCPHCGRWTPLIGNWWLARVSKGASEESEEEEGTKSGEFEHLAWMQPVKTGDSIAIKVVDLNKELGVKTIKAKVNARQGIVVVAGRKYQVPQKNIDAKRETTTCLHCNNPIRKGMEDWYVKEALRDWNQKLEQYLTGQIDLQTLRETVKARLRLLVKVKKANKDLEFEPATREDDEKLWRALEKLRQIWGDPDIPREGISLYSVRYLFPILYGITEWYKLFNPRQLLTLVKLVKLIREAGKQIEQEKQREGWSREDAHKYAEAITTYLAIALCKFADYNSIVSGWQITYLIAAHTLAMRGIAMIWNWGEYNPRSNYTGTIEAIMSRNIINALSYLTGALTNSPTVVKVLRDNATELSSLRDRYFDVIVTDPPYRDDVPYAELSDFYYVWLKRALSDVVDVGGLLIRRPRFIPEAFFQDGVEIEVQWRYFADKEVSENEGRSIVFRDKVDGDNVGSFKYFKKLLTRSFQAMAERLVDDGLLVTYYAHTSPDAWEALLEAGWGGTKLEDAELRGAKLRITSAHALVTESTQRVTARGKAGLDISIVAVWRKGVNGQALADEAYAQVLDKCVDYADTLRKKGFEGVNLFVGVLGCVLSVFTQYERVVGVKSTRELVEKYVYPATAEVIARSLGGSEMAGKLSSTSLFYLLGKVLIARRPRQTRRSFDRSTAIILAIGTRNEVNALEGYRLVEREGEKFYLIEPAWGQRDLVQSIRSTLETKGINLRSPEPRTAVDMLHILEYYATTLPRNELDEKVKDLRSRYPAFYEEALTLVQILTQILPPNDPERELVAHVASALVPGGGTSLDRYFVKGGR